MLRLLRAAYCKMTRDGITLLLSLSHPLLSRLGSKKKKSKKKQEKEQEKEKRKRTGIKKKEKGQA
jgi:hypothetical protein